MDTCISRVTNMPLSYLSDIRKLEKGQYLMLGTKYSPAYSLMILTSIITSLGFAGYIIYYFFATPEQDPCYKDVLVPVYILAILYPIQTIFIFFCLSGSVAKSQSNVWKIVCIILFGPLVPGLGFGGLGIIYLCILQKQYPLDLPLTFFLNQTFITVMVYFYITFFLLYLILIPILTYLYNRQKEQLKNDPASSNCATFCCILYVIFQLILLVTALFILVLLIAGPIILTYIWVELIKAKLNNNNSPQDIFFGLCLASVFAPIGVFLILFFIDMLVTFIKSKGNSDQIQTTDTKAILLPNQPDTSREIPAITTPEKDNKNTVRFTVTVAPENIKQQELVEIIADPQPPKYFADDKFANSKL